MACPGRPFRVGERIMIMKTSKSTLTVAREAPKAGQESLPGYRHPKSPHKFTQPQLFACLVVQEFRCLDYRGVWVLLQEWPELRKIPGLTRVPHFTTLWAAGKRLLAKPQADALLEGVLQRCRRFWENARRWPRSIRPAWNPGTSRPTTPNAANAIEATIKAAIPSSRRSGIRPII